MQENAVAVTSPIVPEVVMGFNNRSGFELMQRGAQLLASSQIVPKDFQQSVANCTIALELAQRIGVSPLAVMQNLYIVHGKPSWASTFIIAAINATGKFSPLRFQITDAGEKTVSVNLTVYEKNTKTTKTFTEKIKDRICVAWVIEKETGERLESPPVSMEMAVLEGWYSKDGSKWKTMPDLMLRYRAATFFGRLYAPEILMGMKGYDEIVDIDGQEMPPARVKNVTPIQPEKPALVEPDKASGQGFDKAVPKGIDKKAFAEFLKITADTNGISVDSLKAYAFEKEAVDGLLKSFESWQEERKPKTAPNVEPEIAPEPCPDSPDNTYTKDHCDACAKRGGCPIWPAK